VIRTTGRLIELELPIAPSSISLHSPKSKSGSGVLIPEPLFPFEPLSDLTGSTAANWSKSHGSATCGVALDAGGGLEEDDAGDEPTSRSLSQNDPFPLFVTPGEVEWVIGLRLALVDDEGREMVGFNNPSKALDDLSGTGCNGTGAPVYLDELDVVVDVKLELNCSQFPKPENCSFSLSSFNRLSSAS